MAVSNGSADLQAQKTAAGMDGADLYSAAVLWVALASVIAIALLSLRRFDVPLLLSAATIGTAAVLSVFRLRIVWKWPKASAALVTVAVLALFLRSDLHPHLKGGQDQGLYTNMAAQMLHSKALTFQDSFRAQLDTQDKALYDQAPMDAINLVDGEHSTYSVAFYPLHPAWMAVSIWAFGEKYHTLSLLLFAALGIIGGYFLALQLFGSNRAAALAGIFLALNPALVFFSKFPVTEVVGFAFTVNGFLFFLKACRSPAAAERWLNLLIAVLCFNGLFYTRMQFFMYVPFMGLLFAYALVATRESVQRRLVMAAFPAALVATFLVSLAFYHHYQPQLYAGIVGGHMDKLAKLAMLVVLGLGVLGLGGLLFLANRRWMLARLEALNRLIDRHAQKVTWLLPVVLLCSIPSIMAFYKTGSMAPFPWAVPVDSDPWLIRYHALYRLVQMISPIGLLLLVLLPLLRVRWSGPVLWGVLFLVLVWAAVLTQPVIPYLYYYGRYLAGEMVPYSLILAAGVLAWIWDQRSRLLGAALVLVQCVFFLVFSLAQYSHVESEDAEFYARVAERVGRNDVLLAVGLDDRHLVGLRLTYGLNVMSLTVGGSPLRFDPQLSQRMADAAERRGGHLYLLTGQAPATIKSALVESIPFRTGYLTNEEHVQQGQIYAPDFRSRLMLPTRYMQVVQDIELYRIDPGLMASVISTGCVDDLQLSSSGSMGVYELHGFSGPEDKGRWTDGNRAVYSCELQPERQVSMVEIDATGYVPADHAQRVEISVNDQPATSFQFNAGKDQQRLQVPVKPDGAKRLNVEIRLPDAISPQQAQGIPDGRQLGIYIKEIEIK